MYSEYPKQATPITGVIEQSHLYVEAVVLRRVTKSPEASLFGRLPDARDFGLSNSPIDIRVPDTPFVSLSGWGWLPSPLGLADVGVRVILLHDIDKAVLRDLARKPPHDRFALGLQARHREVADQQ